MNTRDLDRAFAGTLMPFRRDITDEELMKIQGSIALAFAVELPRELLRKIAHFCCHVEKQIDGRASGSLEDLVVRYLVVLLSTLAAEPGDNAVTNVEIGALYGATTILACHALRLAGENNKTAVIDPFEGYYGNDIDPVTGLTVTEDRFWSNLAKFKYGNGDAVVLKGLSTEKNIINSASGFSIRTLIIDGDHTYDGIKQDWINYSPLVRTGGHVLIDDYNSRFWPDVTRFVNNEVLAFLAFKWEPVLLSGNTIVLRRLPEIPGGGDLDDRLVHEIRGLENKFADALKELEAVRDQLDTIHNSGSWRLTAPFRDIRTRMTRLLNRVAGPHS